MAFEHSALANDTASLIHQAKTYRRLFADAFGSGVADTAALAVTEKSGTPNMSVDVAAGGVFIPTDPSVGGSAYAYNAGTINKSLSASDPTNDRIDLIIVAWENGDPGEAEIIVVEGTPAGSPSAPAITEDNYLLLATVEVGAAASSITDSDITDERTFVASAAAPTLVKFTSSGSFTKASYPGAKAVRVRAVGGGGGGGGSGVANKGGGGGGGGGYAEDTIAASALLASETVTIGAAGAAGAAGTNDGGSGGASSFGGHVAASGGIGGKHATSGAADEGRGGDGGAGTAGAIQVGGQAGGSGGANNGPGGLGGSSALGGGGRGGENAGSGTARSGQDGRAFGGGGGGGVRITSNAPGGAGAAGVVLVEVIY